MPSRVRAPRPTPFSLLALSILFVGVGIYDRVEAQTLGSDYDQVVTVNPLGIMFGLVSGEWERPRTETTSIGVAASFYSASSLSNYLSAEAKYRFYPQGRAMHGFSIGGAGGITAVTQSCGQFSGFGCEANNLYGLTIGLGLDYQWFMGEVDRFAVAVGLGAKRLFVSGDILDGSTAYPTLRLSVGYAL